MHDMKFQEEWPNSFKVMKGQNQNFEKAVRPVRSGHKCSGYKLEYEVSYITLTYWGIMQCGD